MQQINYNTNIEVVETIGNYGNIIRKNITKSFIDDDGDILKYSTYVYNVMLKDQSLVSNVWFDIYEYDRYGNCIIGFSRTNHELAELWEIPLYRLGSMVCEQYKYRYGAINSNGFLAVQPIYDRLTFNNENSYTAYFNGNLGYVDSFDGHHITPIIFSHAQPFFENKAAVEFNGQMGYVDRNKIMRNPNNKNEYAIEPKYDIASDFENGYAEVSKDGQLYVIDGNGNICSKRINNFREDKSEQPLQCKKVLEK